jgi:CelD/BcsL family acetyltransferase involved in cellulose biosynthesis
MKTTIIPAAQLSDRHICAWSEIQRARAELDSPFLRPEFTQAVASVRDDVEVAVLEEHGEMVGFFPYQRSSRGVAAPVGGRMSDFQAVIVRKNAAWDPEALLQSCGLKAWHFNHLMVSQEELRPYHRLVEDSPYTDLSGGFAAYCARHGRRAENPFPHITIKARKLQRQNGPLRFEVDTKNPRVFDTLIEWKIQQYRQMRVANCFAVPWTRALVQRILNCRDEAFAGMLSALYAGDHLVAAQFGMRSDNVLHYWFIGYDPAFSKFSPGLIRDLKLMEAAASLGIRRLDFGKGMTDMKQYLMCGASQVAVGSVDLRPLVRILQRPWHLAYQWARNSPLRRPGARALYHLREWLTSRSGKDIER